MGIFKNFTKTLKKAAPIIGAGIGMYFGGPMGASIGSGIGSLAAGQDTEQALLNAALAGGTAYMSGYGKGFEKLPTSGSMSNISGPEMMMNQTTTTPVTAIKEAGGSGIINQIGDFVKNNKGLTAGIAGLGLAGLMGEEEQKMGEKMRDYPVGKTRLGYGRIGDKMYNLDDEEERKQYFEDNRKRQGAEDIESSGFSASEGGIAEMDRIIQDPNDTRNFAEKMSYNQLRHNVRAGKEGYTEAELGMVRSELAKREAPKISMPSMMDLGDPSQLMRNFMVGGEVRGPGSGTSDSVPARLSDGEFVVTAKAVRGAGGGDRNVGAARMYDMMSQLEGAA